MGVEPTPPTVRRSVAPSGMQARCCLMNCSRRIRYWVSCRSRYRTGQAGLMTTGGAPAPTCKVSGQGESRTPMPIVWHDVLSVACLPFHHSAMAPLRERPVRESNPCCEIESLVSCP